MKTNELKKGQKKKITLITAFSQKINFLFHSIQCLQPKKTETKSFKNQMQRIVKKKNELRKS